MLEATSALDFVYKTIMEILWIKTYFVFVGRNNNLIYHSHLHSNHNVDGMDVTKKIDHNWSGPNIFVCMISTHNMGQSCLYFLLTDFGEYMTAYVLFTYHFLWIWLFISQSLSRCQWGAYAMCILAGQLQSPNSLGEGTCCNFFHRVSYCVSSILIFKTLSSIILFLV